MSNNSGNETIIGSGYNHNFKIIPGSSMVISAGTEVNYFYTYIDFSQVQIQNFAENPTENDAEFIQTMDGKKHLIWIPLLGSLDSGGLFDADKDGQILNHGDLTKYNSLPIGMRTAAGSIINQPFVPSQDFGTHSSDTTTSIINGIVYSADTDKSQTYSSLENFYEWNVVGVDVVEQYQPEQFDDIIVGDGSLRRVFGHKQPYNYITNKQCKQKYVDVDNVIADRSYTCVMPDDGGSFAFCYEYGPYTPVNVKRGPKDIAAAPFLLLTISSIFYNDTKKASTDKLQSAGFVSGQVACYITMPPDGQITARVGKYQTQGGLSVPSNDLLPPQCKKEGNQFTTKPLFIYPIYSGLVVTNSLIKSSQSKGEQIFVSFPSKTDPRFETKIHGANMSPQQSAFASRLQPKSQLKLFPSVFQQTPEHELQLSVNSDFRINFKNQLQLACMRSLCNFAYCPLFFSRTLKFTLYFKGANNQQDNNGTNGTGTLSVAQNTSFSYYFFPIVYNANIQKVNLTSGGKIKGKETLINPITNCTSVTYDSEKKETIYKADFEFMSENAFRYPLQVFGALCVLKRYGSQFKVFNSNGTFNLPFSSSYVSSVSSYWDLITNCDLQFGLDGVTGSLNLDSYPIVGEIDKILPDQSIGEIDLDIQFVNNIISGSDFCSCSCSSFSLFKGFGMQVSKQNAENSYTLGVNLVGTQKKMQDMKLICAPFWDGDRLQAICSYFQSFLNLNLKMIDYTVKNFVDAKPIDNNLYSAYGTWSACTSDNLIAQGGSHQFRVGRSWNWQSPHINFTTGTSCLQALNKLADDTSCVFIVGYDGTGYFYQLNPFGYPYYVDNQTDIVTFPLASVINFNIRPQLQSKYNAVATFGFLVQKGANKDKQDSLKVSTAPGSFYTQIGVDSAGNIISGGSFNFPWQRTTLSVQQGYLTKLQLLRAHSNRIKRSKADFFTGSVTVLGNPHVNHIYQRIKIGDQQFFVNSINHSINLQSKTWQTTYGIQWTSLMDQQDKSSKI